MKRCHIEVKTWNIEALTGYKPKTTFYEDFSIADAFGISAIKGTYKRAFSAWKNNVEYLTELIMVLNWKIWQWHEQNEVYERVYNDLWEQSSTWALENLSGDDLTYYLNTTD